MNEAGCIDRKRKKQGFILVELLVFSLLLALAFGGMTDLAGVVVRASRVAYDRRHDVFSFSSLVAEARAGSLEGTCSRGNAGITVTPASGGRGDCVIEAALARGSAGSAVLSWRRRDVRGRK